MIYEPAGNWVEPNPRVIGFLFISDNNWFEGGWVCGKLLEFKTGDKPALIGIYFN